jgi:hypothetical protein
MTWIRDFWNDEFGALLSAEAAAIGTITVIGATAGLSVASKAVNAELGEVALAIRSLDQSYAFPGHGSRGGRVFTAGSSYTQPPVEKSLDEVRADIKGSVPAEGTSKPEQPKKKKKTKADADEQSQADFPRVPGDTETAIEANAAEATAGDKVDAGAADTTEPSA